MLHDINSEAHKLHAQGLQSALSQRHVHPAALQPIPRLFMRRTRHPDTGKLTQEGIKQAISLAREQVEILKRENYLISRDYQL